MMLVVDSVSTSSEPPRVCGQLRGHCDAVLRALAARVLPDELAQQLLGAPIEAASACAPSRAPDRPTPAEAAAETEPQPRPPGVHHRSREPPVLDT